MTLLVCISLCAMAAFAMVYSLQKYQLSIYIISLYLIYVVAGSKKIAVKPIAACAGALYGFLCLMYYYYFQMFSVPLKNVIIAPIGRIFAGQLIPQYYYYLYYDTLGEHLYGATLPNPMGILPRTPVNYTEDIWYFALGRWYGEGVGSMPTTFWGEIFLNYGVPAVFVISFCIGIYITSVEYYIRRHELKPHMVAFYVWCMVHFMSLSITGFSFLVFDFEFILMLVVMLLLRLANDCESQMSVTGMKRRSLQVTDK